MSADQVTNFKVKVRILPDSYGDLIEDKPESYSPFRPGMTATVDIITKHKKDVIGIPISAIVIKTDTTEAKSNLIVEADKKGTERYEAVYVKKDGLAELRVVKTGIQDDSNIEILSGLKEGETVITGPYNTVTKSLKSGDKVKVIGAEKSK